ncbi:CBO0543 family protein [Effusibacillus dendaii]|uniref:Uncharacterized protein n=1 Tax=Effusibacillus dendaii TaxID=2743772 RepID=A0A7I8DGM6_9BACL|nr:CBO0543 family protein [Effusibacillus dendaii]BCJ88502.1 hypothetical protein skT53_34870 [Effusibacillus dendaii]
MSTERLISLVAWLIMAYLLWKFVPRNKIREAHVIFLFKQAMTWVFGLMVAHWELIEYPVRIFAGGTQSSFTYDYFIDPSIAVLFNLRYPENGGRWRKFLHYVIYCSAVVFPEWILEDYTDLIEYKKWAWYWSWITLFATLFISRQYYLWFFKIKR